jgi:hypothetical protein
LENIGFKEVLPTHNGAWAAGMLFDQVPDDQRPTTMNEIDELLKPIIKIVIQMPAPLLCRSNTWDPMITAIK